MRSLLNFCAGAFLVLAFSGHALAQAPASGAKPESKSESAPPPKEESSVTDHTVRIGSETISYRATAATMLLKNEKDEPLALVYSTAYTRSDMKDASQRPLAFLYNGGPGSSSAWLHMGAFGPRRVVTVDAAATPPAPYSLTDNAESLLDVADLVFIDPVGTGFSRPAGKSEGKDFWGIDEDVKSVGQFIQNYVTRNSRWNSPKFLIGESYGTFRSAALVNYLQQRGMDFNGVVLISNVLDLGTISFYPGEDLSYILYLPSYAATAWYHKVLKDRPADLNQFLEEVRRYAATDYAQALLKGAKLTADEKAAVAKKLSAYTGLSEEYLIKDELRVNLPQFREELQRSRELITGRLDARFSGPSPDPLGEFAFEDPQSDAITGAFTAAWNTYVREELKFGRDLDYKLTNYEIGGLWNWKRAGGGFFGFPGAPNVEGDLSRALISNTHLQVEVENGLYDLATPFFGTEYTMDHLEIPENLRAHVHEQYYEAGHMMYLHDDSRKQLKSNIARFIENTSHH